MGSIESKAGDVIASAESDEDFTEALRNNLQRLIIYAEAAPTDMQIKVAERLANEAVKRKSATGAEGEGCLGHQAPHTRSLGVQHASLSPACALLLRPWCTTTTTPSPPILLLVTRPTV